MMPHEAMAPLFSCLIKQVGVHGSTQAAAVPRFSAGQLAVTAILDWQYSNWLEGSRPGALQL
jgi:hypothetical protein